jgi:UDP-glucose 4-epimerase
VVGIFMRCARLGLPFPIFGDGKQTRAFSYVSSVAEAIALAPFAGAAENGTFNIGGSLSMSVNQLAECVSAAMGVECRMEYLPPRREALHASCTHGRSLSVFPQAYAKEFSIMDGLRAMAAWVKTLPEIPPPTPCPSPVEIADNLPPSWAKIEGS